VVTAVGLLGGSAGRWIADAIGERGIASEWIACDGETRTCFTVAAEGGNALTEFHEDAGPVDSGTWAALEEAAKRWLARALLLCVAGSLPPGAPRDGYARLVRLARLAGVPAAIDVTGEPLVHALAERPHLVKVNAAEAASAVGASLGAEEAAVRLAAGGHAIITEDRAGFVVVAPGTVPVRVTLDVGGRFPVGSGDAVLGACAAGLDGGREWPETLRLAAGAAAANAMTPGAGCFAVEDARALARRAVLSPAAG